MHWHKLMYAGYRRVAPMNTDSSEIEQNPGLRFARFVRYIRALESGLSWDTSPSRNKQVNGVRMTLDLRPEWLSVTSRCPTR